jgi:hypothetical protein
MEEKILPLPGSKLRTIQSVTSSLAKYITCALSVVNTLYVAYLAPMAAAQALESNCWNKGKEIGKGDKGNFEGLISQNLPSITE